MSGVHISGYQFDYVFNWTILKYPQIGSSSSSSSRGRVSIYSSLVFYFTFEGSVSYKPLIQIRQLENYH